MSSAPRPLSADPVRFEQLLTEAVDGLAARDLSAFLDELKAAGVRQVREPDSSAVVELLESLALTHALASDPDYQVAAKSVIHRAEPLQPEDLESLRIQYNISA